MLVLGMLVLIFAHVCADQPKTVKVGVHASWNSHPLAVEAAEFLYEAEPALFWDYFDVALRVLILTFTLNHRQHYLSPEIGNSGRGKFEDKMYAILQVPMTADAKEIRKAYRKLALKYHPDKQERDRVDSRRRS